ncbi:MAG: fasciclin domain-containing protein, partial [Chitinophagaceae bacterium]
VAAVKAAGLAETLSGAGPFTVFAPTNAAFDKLPAGTVDNLVKPEKKTDLTNILTYHVVSGTFRAADLTDGQKLKTVQGKELTVKVKDGAVMIDGATVTTPDVISSNGVTHVVDGVLTPKK